MMEGDVVELDENHTLVARLDTGGRGHLMMHEDGSLALIKESSDLAAGPPEAIVFSCNRTEINKCETSCFGHFVAGASCELVAPFRSSAKACVDSQEAQVEALSWPPRAIKASHYLQQPQPLSLDASNRLFTGASNLLRYFDLVGRTEALDEFAVQVLLILGLHVSVDDKRLDTVRAHMKALSVAFPDAATIAELHTANNVDLALFNEGLLPFKVSSGKSPW